ncbi:MAG: hypothetical protein NVSMB51_04020 [Solirubrobacteraceae bacterium]
MNTSQLRALKLSGALLLLVVGVVHVQQYASFIKDVPTIGPLFALNGIGAGVLCVMLGTRTRLLAAIGGIGLCAGSLISIAISRYAAGGFFSYREPTLRTPILIAVAAELVAVAVLAVFAARERAAGAAPA